jgi:regulator of sigma E protease
MSILISILVFILILGILVIVHEFGHFIVAKKSSIRVDEFGFGFPPRAKKLFKRGETVFTLNWLPFGGFVKIFGENPNDVAKDGPNKGRSFVDKSKWTQAAVLFAGPLFNLLFAWLVLFLMFAIGAPTVYTDDQAQYISDPYVAVVEVAPDAPAGEAGILVGDQIMYLEYSDQRYEIGEASEISSVISERGTETFRVGFERKGKIIESEVTPEYGLFEGQDTPALGVALDTVGTLRLPIHKALWAGLTRTWDLTVSTFDFLVDLIKGLFVGDNTNLQSVTGPIGIVPIVGDALQIGFSFLVIITALISINLAIINLLPFPALDGGRLLFILIEAIKGSPINPKTSQVINAVGFFILIGLMLIVTARDIIHLFRWIFACLKVFDKYVV